MSRAELDILSPTVEAGLRKRLVLRERWWWAVMLGVMVCYGLGYGRMVWLSGAVPTFDQAAYFKKTYALAEVFYGGRVGAMVNPVTYLGEPAANRPPLLLMAGAVLGPKARPEAVGVLWLVLRLGVLAWGLRAVGKLAGTRAWIPAAAMTILATPGWLLMYPNMYMMDQAFEAFGLWAFACLLRDFLTPTWKHAGGAALATLLLLLIKPAALMFVLPLYGLLAFRAVERVRREARWRDRVGVLWGWGWPYAGLALAVVLLGVSPYGRAVAEQYAMGARGWWGGTVSWVKTLGFVALLTPPWVLALVAMAVGLQGVRGQWKSAAGPWVVIAAVLSAGWWFVFNAWLTYTLDPRIVPAAMPVAVCGALVLACRTRVMTGVANVAAGGLLGVSLLAFHGALPAGWIRPANVLQPLPAAQKPVAEVGLLDVARRLAETIPAANDTPPRLMVLTSDDFVELNSLQLALRFTGHDGAFFVDSHPWGAADLDLGKSFSFGWFLTKEKRNRTALTGDVWVSLDAIDALVREEGSPLRGHFEKVWSMPVRQPDLEDVVTLYRLKKPVGEKELRAAERFIGPRFLGMTEEGVMREQAGRGGE